MPSSRWGGAIQRLLLERGWTQKRLAEAASLRPNTLTNIVKHGKDTDTGTLARLALALGVDIAELFLTVEQSEILRMSRERQVNRVKETILSELSTSVARLVREDYERLLEQSGYGGNTEKTVAKRAAKRRRPR